MKKLIVLLVLALVVAGGIFAQEEESAGAIKNWISGEVSLLGGGVRYERMLTEKMSIGANVYFSTFFIIWSDFEVGASFRYYLYKDIFFIGGGLGFHMHSGAYDYKYSFLGRDYTLTTWGWVIGAAITPEAGFRIDVGEKGHFFLQPGIKLPVTFGGYKPSTITWVSGLSSTNSNLKSEFKVGFSVVPYFGMGFAF